MNKCSIYYIFLKNTVDDYGPWLSSGIHVIKAMMFLCAYDTNMAQQRLDPLDAERSILELNVFRRHQRNDGLDWLYGCIAQLDLELRPSLAKN